MSFDNILKEFGMKDEADLARRLDDDPDLSPSEFVESVKVEINGLIIENNDLEEENKELKEQLEVCEETKDAFWNDWLNEEFGDALYPLDPPEPDEFVKNVKKLKEENEELKKERDEIQSYLLPPGAFPNTDAFIVKLRELKRGNEVLKEELRITKENAAKKIVDLQEENKKLKTVERIIGENWGGHFREAFEMIGVEEDLIESGFSTPEDFE